MLFSFMSRLRCSAIALIVAAVVVTGRWNAMSPSSTLDALAKSTVVVRNNTDYDVIDQKQLRSKTTTRQTDAQDLDPSFGFVLVDTRENGVLGHRVKPLITRLLHMSEFPVELWMSQNTEPDRQLGAELTALLGERLFYQTMKSNHTYGETTLSLEGKVGGYIGKAYALKESRFDVPILFDGDVWPCNMNITSVVQEAIQQQKDVVWSEAPSPFGGTLGRNDMYVSHEIEAQLDEYKQFSERNTGTIFAVNRRHPVVHKWLQLALDIFVQQFGGDYKHDQPALRESFFLYRHELSEYLMDGAKACRFGGADGCLCQSSTCDVVHGPPQFAACMHASN